ncbi:MAG: hypothetical protein ABSD28_01550 [Tepidisphaeraceae bacterium]
MKFKRSAGRLRVANLQTRGVGGNLETLRRVQKEVPRRIQFNPIGSILMPRVRTGNGGFNLANAAGMESLSHGFQNTDLIVHVFNAVGEQNEVKRRLVQVLQFASMERDAGGGWRIGQKRIDAMEAAKPNVAQTVQKATVSTADVKYSAIERLLRNTVQKMLEHVGGGVGLKPNQRLEKAWPAEDRRLVPTMIQPAQEPFMTRVFG